MSGSAGTLPPFGQHIDDEIFRDLNMVLLGRTGIGKSASGNTILGRQAFKSMKSSTSVTRGVAVDSGTVCGQRVTVYDTPGLFHTEMSEDEIQWMYKEVLQRCESGPCVFLLVIKADRFTDKERGTVEKIEELLGEERLKKTWILFTRGDKLEEENMTIEEYIDFSGPLKKVVQKYDQRYHVFNNKTTGSHEQARLLIEKMIHSLKGSGTMSGVIPRSRAKGTDICAINNYYYIIRSDLGCYMKTSDLNEDSDISICHLHPACQNGDHYIGGDSYFHIIKGNSCRRVTDLSTDSSAVVYSLHPNCQGGDHYFAAHNIFTSSSKKRVPYE